MRVAISLIMAGCLLASGCKDGASGDAIASSAPSCAAADDLLLKIESISENVGMQDAFQAGLQTLPDNIRQAAVNRIDAKVASDGARMRAAEGGPRQWVALLLLSAKSEARAVQDFRYCNGDFDFGNGQRWHWTYSMSNGPTGPELRIQSAQMASGGVVAGAAHPAPLPNATVTVTGVDIGNALGTDQRVALPLSVLSSEDATIYAAVATNTSDPTASVVATLSAKWVYVDTGQTVFEEGRDASKNFTGLGVTVFSIHKPDGWPPGTYQVEIGLNGAAAQTRQFRVQAEGGASTAMDAATEAALAAASAAEGYDGAAVHERERIAEEKRQLENDRRELARQRQQLAAQRAAGEAEAANQAHEQEQAWREQQEAQARGPTADELYESRRRECPGGFLGTDCRKRIRDEVCAGHWSSSPEPGYSKCRN